MDNHGVEWAAGRGIETGWDGYYLEKAARSLSKPTTMQVSLHDLTDPVMFSQELLRLVVAAIWIARNDPHATKEIMIKNEFLTPALESVLSGMLGGMEDRMARMMFKLAVELSMTMHIIAAQGEVDEETLVRLRGFCVDEVKRLGGKISFDKAYEHQKR